jgi:tetratricopeptide (TPR) repeat protein
LPTTPELRREQIKLQVALITALLHVKGHASLETKAAVEQARAMIEQAERLGEPLEDPLALFSVLFGFWGINFLAFNGEALRDVSAQFLSLAAKQGETVPLMVGHRIMGVSLAFTGNLTQAREHYDLALSAYNPAAHREFATRFTADIRVGTLIFRSLTFWLLGYPDAALADVEQALTEARQIDQASTTMPARNIVLATLMLSGNYAQAGAEASRLIALADEKARSIGRQVG